MNKTYVLFQNSDFLIVNKDGGISVHNNEDPQNLMLKIESELKIQKLFPVHRLDKETSGIQVFALNEDAARKGSEEFEGRSVQKTYVGVLRGQLKAKEGRWTAPLTDKSEGRKNPEGVSKNRVQCETRFKVLKGSQYFTLCEFDLITGRQHQIRKHTALTNHPIVGDPRYGDAKYNEKIASLYKSDRMYLHCSHLQLLDMTIDCAAPENFARLLDG